MATEIDSLQIKIESQSGSASKNIDALVTSLGNLKGAAKLTTVVNNLTKLSTALNSFNSSFTGTQKLAELGTALRDLSSTKNLSGLSSALNSLKNLPKTVSKLDTATLDAFSIAVNKITVILTPLADKAQSIAAVFNKLPSVVKKTAKAMDEYTASASKATTKSSAFSKVLTGLNLAAITMVARRVGNVIASSVTSINDYVENVNLFTISMGEYADEAMEYAQKVSDSMGVDLSEFVRNQGIFMSMASGFGLASEQAYKMSRGLTELSYDLSSFFNISLDAVGDGAFAKVQSGIAGELEPLRRLGFALDEATLQQTAYDHGIRASVRTMNQAQKATLRYTTIVEQASKMGVIGDLSRTLITPANALRILKQQTEQLSRAFGSLFIPMLIKVIPYVQAFVKVLTQAVQKLAELWGFTMPTIDYSGMASGTQDMADGLDESAENAKKLKNYMMGFDELNVIDTSSSEAAGSGNGLANDLGLDIDSVWDESIFKNLESQVDSLMPKMEKMAKTLGIVVGAFAGFKVITIVATGLASLMTSITALSSGAGVLGSVGTALATIGGSSVVAGLAIVVSAILAVAAAAAFLIENWEGVKTAFKTFFEENIGPKLEALLGTFDRIKEIMSPITTALTPVIDAIRTFVTESLGIKSLKDAFEFIGGIIVTVFSTKIAGVISAVVTMIEGFARAVEGVLTIIGGVIGILINGITGDYAKVWESTKNTIEGIKTLFWGLWDATVGALVEFVHGVIDMFFNLWDVLVGHSIVPDTINAIIEWFASLPLKILGGLGTFCENVALAFKDMWTNIKTWFTTNVAPKFTLQYWLDMFSSIKKGASTKLGEAKTAITGAWTSIKEWWTTNVAPKFTLDYWVSVFSSIGDGLKQAVSTAISTASQMFTNFMSSLSFSGIGEKLSGAISGIGDFVGNFTLNIPKFANGGFIEDGLFTMNHGEIAGRFNNGQSVVANNEQIIAGISEGVYKAVTAAMGGKSSDSQNVNVYLDGKQIYASVKKTESERGKQLFGNQLGYGF